MQAMMMVMRVVKMVMMVLMVMMMPINKVIGQNGVFKHREAGFQ